jgi:4-oxalocrotonate tautomerase
MRWRRCLAPATARLPATSRRAYNESRNRLPREQISMPFINVRLAKELIADDPEGKKAAIGKRITEAVTGVTGVKSEEVWIVMEEVPARDWFVGGRDVESMKFKT